MSERFAIPAISDVAEPEKIRVVIFINGEFVHVPLTAIMKALQQQIADIDYRVSALETP